MSSSSLFDLIALFISEYLFASFIFRSCSIDFSLTFFQFKNACCKFQLLNLITIHFNLIFRTTEQFLYSFSALNTFKRVLKSHQFSKYLNLTKITSYLLISTTFLLYCINLTLVNCLDIKLLINITPQVLTLYTLTAQSHNLNFFLINFRSNLLFILHILINPL